LSAVPEGRELPANRQQPHERDHMATSKIKAPARKGPAAKKAAIKPAKKGSARAAKESAAVSRANKALGRGGSGVGRGTRVNSSTFGGG